MTNEKDIKINLTVKEDFSLIIEFNDTIKNECTLLKSSFKDENICFGVDERYMYLSKNMVKILLPYLKKFADTGELI